MFQKCKKELLNVQKESLSEKLDQTHLRHGNTVQILIKLKSLVNIKPEMTQLNF